MVFEANVALAYLGLVHRYRINLTEFREKLLELIFSVVAWQVSYEQICEFFALGFPLILFGVNSHRDDAISNLLIIQLGNGLLSALLLQELYVSESSAGSIGENFKFA